MIENEGNSKSDEEEYLDIGKEQENHLLELARESERTLEDFRLLEPEILDKAFKNCMSNYNAWKANLQNGYGKEETNKKGMAKYLKQAEVIKARLDELRAEQTA